MTPLAHESSEVSPSIVASFFPHKSIPSSEQARAMKNTYLVIYSIEHAFAARSIACRVLLFYTS